MLELKDLIDGIVGITTIVIGWLVRSMYSRPTHAEVRQMIQDNQQINNAAMSDMRDDIKEMKQVNRDIAYQINEIKDMLYKALPKT